jgi:hypothetical protein
MRLAILAASIALVLSTQLSAADPLEVGVGVADITPDMKSGRPVWLAGYGFNRAATGVHDPLFARAVARHGTEKLAMISVDLVGVQHPLVKWIRGAEGLRPRLQHLQPRGLMIGIWGRLRSIGIDEDYGGS